jgi:hypothetical protein
VGLNCAAQFGASHGTWRLSLGERGGIGRLWYGALRTPKVEDIVSGLFRPVLGNHPSLLEILAAGRTGTSIRLGNKSGLKGNAPLFLMQYLPRRSNSPPAIREVATINDLLHDFAGVTFVLGNGRRVLWHGKCPFRKP